MDSAAEKFVNNLAVVVLNPLILLMFAVAMVVFLWGIFEFVKDSDSEEAKSKGRRHMIWGVFGMFVMVGVWGILRILLDTFLPGAL